MNEAVSEKLASVKFADPAVDPVANSIRLAKVPDEITGTPIEYPESIVIPDDICIGEQTIGIGEFNDVGREF